MTALLGETSSRVPAGFPPAAPVAFPPGGCDEKVARALAHGRIYDWPGHHIHTALALAYLFLLPLATAPKDWAFGLLVVWTCVRLPHTWRSYVVFRSTPVFWAAIGWAGWHLASFAWSANLEQAFDELKAQRMLLTPLLLWPILDRAPWLIGAALLGVLAQNVVQALQMTGALPAESGRLPGLIHPIHSGIWFAAAMIWHLSAAVTTRGWLRWASLGLLGAASIGLVMTGSRGPWIAAVVAVPLALLFIMLKRRAFGMGGAIALAGLAGITAALYFGDGMIRPRISEAIEELRSAREEQVYWTDVGLRIGLWGWAWETLESSPVVGVGAGDFAGVSQNLPSFTSARARAIHSAYAERVPGYADALARGKDVTKLRHYRRGARFAAARVDYLERDHAHSTYLHTLARLGIVGGVLLALLLAATLIQCARDRGDHRYALGTAFVVIAWMIGAQFDCYELNGHQLGLLALAIAVTLPRRPPLRHALSAVDAGEVDPAPPARKSQQVDTSTSQQAGRAR